MVAVSAVRWSGLHLWGAVIAVAALCGCPRAPLPVKTEAARCRAAAADPVFRDQPQRRPAVPDRRLVVDAAVAGQPAAKLPGAHAAARKPARRSTQHPRRRRLVGHGRGRRHGRRLRLDRRQERNLPAHPARHLRRIGPRGGRDVHLEHRGRRQLLRHPRGRVHLHRRARRIRLRLRAPVRGDHARAGHRRAPRARREPGVPASRRPAGDRDDHERGRLFGGGGRTDIRHRLEHEHRSAAGTADQLPLQRVRSPLRWQSPEAPRAQQRRQRLGQL